MVFQKDIAQQSELKIKYQPQNDLNDTDMKYNKLKRSSMRMFHCFFLKKDIYHIFQLDKKQVSMKVKGCSVHAADTALKLIQPALTG